MPQSLVSLLGPEQIPHTQVLVLTFLPPPQVNVQLLYSLHKDQAPSSVVPVLILNDNIMIRMFILKTLLISWFAHFRLPAATAIYDAKDSETRVEGLKISTILEVINIVPLLKTCIFWSKIILYIINDIFQLLQ